MIEPYVQILGYTHHLPFVESRILYCCLETVDRIELYTLFVNYFTILAYYISSILPSLDIVFFV